MLLNVFCRYWSEFVNVVVFHFARLVWLLCVVLSNHCLDQFGGIQSDRVVRILQRHADHSFCHLIHDVLRYRPPLAVRPPEQEQVLPDPLRLLINKQ